MIDIQKSKPVDFLKTFNTFELKKLERFINADYLVNSLLMKKMLEWMLKYYPDFNHKKCTAVFLSKKLFPGDEHFKEQKLRKKLSEFSKLIQTFIATEELDQNEFFKTKLLSDFLFKKNKHNAFLKLSNKRLKQLEENPINDTNFHLEKSKINEQLYALSLKTKFQPQAPYLYQATDHLDRFYHLKKLEHFCAENSLNQLFKKEKNSTLNQIDLTAIQANYGEDPVFKLYLQLIELKDKETNTLLFNTIFKDLKTNIKSFSVFQQKFIFSQLLNYSFEQVKHKKSIYLKKQLELYVFGLEEDFFVEGNFIPDTTFLNIGFSATLNKAFDLVDLLINKYGNKLSPREQTRAIQLLKSFMAFHKGKYQTAYDLILNIEEPDLHYKLRTKLLSIRCLYHIQLKDKSYLSTLKSQIKSFENFISREKRLNATNQSSYLNFTKVIKTIIQFEKSSFPKKDKNKLIKKLNTYDVIIAKEWLLNIIKKA